MVLSIVLCQPRGYPCHGLPLDPSPFVLHHRLSFHGHSNTWLRLVNIAVSALGLFTIPAQP